MFGGDFSVGPSRVLEQLAGEHLGEIDRAPAQSLGQAAVGVEDAVAVEVKDVHAGFLASSIRSPSASSVGGRRNSQVNRPGACVSRASSTAAGSARGSRKPAPSGRLTTKSRWSRSLGLTLNGLRPPLRRQRGGGC